MAAATSSPAVSAGLLGQSRTKSARVPCSIPARCKASSVVWRQDLRIVCSASRTAPAAGVVANKPQEIAQETLLVSSVQEESYFLDCDALGELQEDLKELLGDLMAMVEKTDTDALRDFAGANLEAVEEQMGNGMGVGVQQAAVLNVLARGYIGLGLPEGEYTLWKAAELASKVDLEEFASVELPGAMTPFEVTSMQGQAGFDTSLQICYRCLQTMQSMGASLPQQLVVVQHIFYLQLDRKAYQEGLALQQEYLEKLEEHRQQMLRAGEKPLPLHLGLRLQVNMATLLGESEDYKKALALFERADPRYREAYPRNSLQRFRCQATWAKYLVNAGDGEGAERLLRRGIWRKEGGECLRAQLFQHEAGIEMASTAGIHLAQAQLLLKKKSEAQATLDSILAFSEAFYGEESHNIINMHTQVASSHYMNSRWGAAAKHYRKALTILRKEGEEAELQYTNYHKTMPMLLRGMVQCRREEGNLHGAEQYARELVEFHQQCSPQIKTDIASALCTLSAFLMERKAWKEAEAKLLLGLSLLSDVTAEDRTSLDLMETVLALRFVYLFQGKKKEAKVYQTWYEEICRVNNVPMVT